VYAHQEATEFLRVAERNSDTPGALAEVRVRLAHIGEAIGHYDEAEELCDLAIEWFSGRGDEIRTLSLKRFRERLRELLGQPARKTLEACLALKEEAVQLKCTDECVALLTMISQTYQRLGDQGGAERIAEECVKLAEGLDNSTLLADSLNRLAITLQDDHPEQAIELFNRALEIYGNAGDYRGQARCHNNLGVYYSSIGEWAQTQRELNTAITLARSAGSPQQWGVATLNLGVAVMKTGDYGRARELFGEALAIFAAVKNSERQLYALYNLAHLDRERAEHESAAELYDVASALAQRIGQSDVEIGAAAGAGLSLLHQGKVDAAQIACIEAEERLKSRPDWFQGRELIEALRIRLAARSGRIPEALQRYREALALAEPTDFYCAAWLTAECADILVEHGREEIRESVNRFAPRAKNLGLIEISKKYEDLLART
jgi:tetratricopeptide (TPR) repeat protein